MPLPYFLVVIPGMLCYNVLADKLEFVNLTSSSEIY